MVFICKKLEGQCTCFVINAITRHFERLLQLTSNNNQPLLSSVDDITITSINSQKNNNSFKHTISWLLQMNIHIYLLKVSRSVADLRGGIPARPPTAQNFCNFMQFIGKFCKIIGLCPLLEGWHPSYGESWICPCR